MKIVAFPCIVEIVTDSDRVIDCCRDVMRLTYRFLMFYFAVVVVGGRWRRVDDGDRVCCFARDGSEYLVQNVVEYWDLLAV